jgi:hypothetical protein
MVSRTSRSDEIKFVPSPKTLGRVPLGFVLFVSHILARKDRVVGES